LTIWRKEHCLPYQDSNSDPSVVQPVAIPTALPRRFKTYIGHLQYCPDAHGITMQLAEALCYKHQKVAGE
jgi:hypothetical protein